MEIYNNLNKHDCFFFYQVSYVMRTPSLLHAGSRIVDEGMGEGVQMQGRFEHIQYTSWGI